MRKRKIDTIVFDLGNTLIRFDHHIAVERIAKRFAIDKEYAYNLFFDSDLTRSYEKGQMTNDAFCREAQKRLAIEMDCSEFMGIWNDIFWEDEKMCDIALRLKKDHKLFLLSNINKSHYEYIASKFKILKLFDEIILSFTVGAMKPEKKIFEDVVRRSGGDRTRLLYIDDREDLIKEAQALGIESVRFAGADALEQELRCRGIFTN